MRLFIAINLPSAIKEKIASIQTHLEKCDLDAKWVNPKNIHLTLKFLGETKEEKVITIEKIISDTAGKFSSFDANFKSFGFFPTEKRPRVFFVSTDNEDRLKSIAKILEDELEKIGFAKENRFRSHLTLARLRSPKNIDYLLQETKRAHPEGKIPVNEISLVKSTLTGSGPIYEEIFKAELKTE